MPHDPRLLEQVGQGEQRDADDRGVLDHRDGQRAERRDHRPERLWEHDPAQRRRVGEAERQRGLDLALADGEHARAQRLGDVRRRVEAERGGARPHALMSTPARRNPAYEMNSSTSSGMLRNTST